MFEFQIKGSFMGAVLCYLVYYKSIQNFKTGMYSLDTASIFATYPNSNANLTVITGLLDQIVGTAILVNILTLLVIRFVT